MKKFDWIASDGGPLILMEKRVKPAWGGTLHRSVGDGSDAVNDYERACQGNKLVFTIPLSTGSALVFGDMPLPTTFWRSAGGLLYVVRLRWAEPTADIEGMFSEMNGSTLDTVENSIEFLVQTSDLILFDAAESGRENGPLLNQSVQPGIYRVSTNIFDPDNSTSMYLHAIEINNA